ncbi:3-phytase|nr:3-phytase [Candidatus Pantoea persica]
MLTAAAPEKRADAPPDACWLLLLAHDTNIAMVRSLMGFS